MRIMSTDYHYAAGVPVSLGPLSAGTDMVGLGAGVETRRDNDHGEMSEEERAAFLAYVAVYRDRANWQVAPRLPQELLILGRRLVAPSNWQTRDAEASAAIVDLVRHHLGYDDYDVSGRRTYRFV